MKFVIQRVGKSSVKVHRKFVGVIEKGLLVLVGIQKDDTEEQIPWMINKLLNLRIFEDDDGKMNLSIQQVRGDLLMVPNFTLYADASKGNRPGFSEAKAPGPAKKLYDALISSLKKTTDLRVETGKFGANMQVSLVNDGPVTIILER